MKKIYILIAVLTAVCISNSLKAQNFHVLDINNSKDAHPSNNSLFADNNTPSDDYLYGKLEYAVLNGIAYFTANDGIHGEELWRSDGTAQGTWMVKDIVLGSGSSYVRKITVSGNKLFFKATDEFYNQQLWESDGTEAGTYLVNDALGSGLYYPSFLTDVNGTLYFFTSYFSNQLWKTDGTTAGTEMICDLSYQLGINYATQLTNVNGRLFFTSNYYYAGELYTSDGTAAGTYMVKDINPFGSSYPSQLTGVDGLLYFAAEDGTGKQLWISDGTDAGTYKANNPGNVLVDDFYSVTFAVKNKNIYFAGTINDGDGSRLCTYNTSASSNNVRVVKNINPGSYSRNLYNITNVNGNLFFTVFNGTDQVLWKSDGTTAGTMQLKNINPGGRNIYLYKHFVNANGTLLFSFYDDAHGYEIWKSDGTETGTVIVKEINTGAYSSQVANITYIGNDISFFEATDGKKGLELWKTDGTAAGTVLVKNINTTTSGSSNPYALTPTPDSTKLMFVATDPQYGTELRITDGTEAGTHVVSDLLKGQFSSSPWLLTNFKNETWFFANILDTSNHTTSDITTTAKLCKTDGTKAGTKILSLPVLEYFLKTIGYVSATEASSNLLYLLLYNNFTGEYELWRTDGTDAGTHAIKTNMPGYYSILLKAVDDKLFFSCYDPTYGNELFVTDGSVSGTGLVKDITPGQNSSSLFDFTSFKGKLYFTADYGYGSFLWSSDGTKAGTKQVTPALAVAGSLAETKDKLFFSAINTVGKGTELYATNGAKAYLVKDIYHGPGSSSIFSLTAGDDVVYFFANDGKNGTELWVSNGTNPRTHIVKDVLAGISFFTVNMTTVHNQLYFMLNDVFWQSDGTNNGTHEVNDANLANTTLLTYFKAFGNKLSFVANEATTGTELYVGNTETSTAIAGNSADTSSVSKISTAFSLSVYPNPAKASATAVIKGNFKNSTITITDISGKLMWQNNNVNQSSIHLPIEKLAAGVYIVTIKNGDEIKTQKLIKE